jgi:hypothetical protein
MENQSIVINNCRYFLRHLEYIELKNDVFHLGFCSGTIVEYQPGDGYEFYEKLLDLHAIGDL